MIGQIIVEFSGFIEFHDIFDRKNQGLWGILTFLDEALGQRLECVWVIKAGWT